ALYIDAGGALHREPCLSQAPAREGESFLWKSHGDPACQVEATIQVPTNGRVSPGTAALSPDMAQTAHPSSRRISRVQSSPACLAFLPSLGIFHINHVIYSAQPAVLLLKPLKFPEAQLFIHPDGAGVGIGHFQDIRVVL